MLRTKNSRILILILVLMLLLPLTGCDRHDMYVIQNIFVCGPWPMDIWTQPQAKSIISAC